MTNGSVGPISGLGAEERPLLHTTHALRASISVYLPEELERSAHSIENGRKATQLFKAKERPPKARHPIRQRARLRLSREQRDVGEELLNRVGTLVCLGRELSMRM